MAGARGTPTWGTRKRRTPSRCSCATCSAACATQSEPGTSISTARGPKTPKAIAVDHDLAVERGLQVAAELDVHSPLRIIYGHDAARSNVRRDRHRLRNFRRLRRE